MSWASIASDQTISYGNLQDAVNTGVFTLVSTIPSPSNRESTKSVVSASVSGFNPNYPPYAVKANNQLVVKRDIYVTGNVTLFPGTAGLVITGITATGFPSFSYPVDHLVAANYVNSIPAQTITVYINGTRTSTPQSIRLYIDTTIYLCQDITSDGSQSFNFTIPTIYGPSYLYIAIEEAACAVTPTISFGGGVTRAAISRTTGQYQVVCGGNGSLYTASGNTQGYIYTSSDYGATWTQRTPYGYWYTVSVSDDGQYMLAGGSPANGIPMAAAAYVSTNYGVTWSLTKMGAAGTVYTASAISNNGTYMYLSDYATGISVSTVQGNYWFGVSWGTTPMGGYSGPVSLTISSTGQYLYAGYQSHQGTPVVIVAKSSDYGATQTSTVIATGYTYGINNLSSSANGSNVIAGLQSYTPIYLKGTTNGGASWNDITGGSTGQKNSWDVVAINNSGTGYATLNNTSQYLQAITTLSSVSPLTAAGSRNWQSVAISGNGTYVLAGHSTGLQRSSNGGSTWSAL